MMSNKITNTPVSLSIPLASVQKYDLNNLPPLDEESWLIEQYFLRYIKVGVIPNLDKYLSVLNADDWTCLMAYNPRQEFVEHLSYEIMMQMDWDFVLECQPDFEKITHWVN